MQPNITVKKRTKAIISYFIMSFIALAGYAQTAKKDTVTQSFFEDRYNKKAAEQLAKEKEEATTNANVSNTTGTIKVPRVRPKDPIQKERFVLSSGDTTIIVHNSSAGLTGKDSEFLFQDARYANQLNTDGLTKYNSLEEATYQTAELLILLESDTEATGKINPSLGFRASQVERMRLQREREAKYTAQASAKKELSEQEMIELYKKFGDTPTYYLNGIQVDFSYIEALYKEEIQSRTIKVENTISGNPNGEIWYKVPSKTLVDLGIIKVDSGGKPVPVEYLNDNKPAPDKNTDPKNSVKPIDYIRVGKKK